MNLPWLRSRVIRNVAGPRGLSRCWTWACGDAMPARDGSARHLLSPLRCAVRGLLARGAGGEPAAGGRSFVRGRRRPRCRRCRRSPERARDLPAHRELLHRDLRVARARGDHGALRSDRDRRRERRARSCAAPPDPEEEPVRCAPRVSHVRGDPPHHPCRGAPARRRAVREDRAGALADRAGLHADVAAHPDRRFRCERNFV